MRETVMEWSADHSVGIEEIDRQHKELLRLFALIKEAIATDQGWSAIHYGLVEVKRFALFHFQFEEALMRLYGFADCDRHAEAHGGTCKKCCILESTAHESLQDSTKEEILKFFSDWLVDHIQGADRSYARHILEGAKRRGAAGIQASTRLTNENPGYPWSARRAVRCGRTGASRSGAPRHARPALRAAGSRPRQVAGCPAGSVAGGPTHP
jgi:hemerythrin